MTPGDAYWVGAARNISRRRDMLYGTQRGGQMRHFRKDLKTATRLGAVRY